MKPPNWAEVEKFCTIDGWAEVRRTSHVHYEKVLASGVVLRTHRSFASRKTMSPGRFKAVLRHQLRVTEDQFWTALVSGQPVDRTDAT